MTSGKYSKAIKLVVDDALAIGHKKFFEDRFLETHLAEPKSHEQRSIAPNFACAAGFRWRHSAGRVLGTECISFNVPDCLDTIMMSAYLWERYTAALIDDPAMKNLVKADTIGFRRSPEEIMDTVLSLCKLYALGRNDAFTRARPLLELYQDRGDAVPSLYASGKLQVEAYETCLYVSLFIARGDSSADKADRMFSDTPILEGAASAWNDDEKFAQWTSSAAEWHFEHSMKHWNSPSECIASNSADLVIPSWVIALNRFRSFPHKRPSSLGNHELLTIGSNVLHEFSRHHLERDPLYIRVCDYSRRHYGSEAFNPLEKWQRFLAEP